MKIDIDPDCDTGIAKLLLHASSAAAPLPVMATASPYEAEFVEDALFKAGWRRLGTPSWFANHARYWYVTKDGKFREVILRLTHVVD